MQSSLIDTASLIATATAALADAASPIARRIGVAEDIERDLAELMAFVGVRKAELCGEQRNDAMNHVILMLNSGDIQLSDIVSRLVVVQASVPIVEDVASPQGVGAKCEVEVSGAASAPVEKAESVGNVDFTPIRRPHHSPVMFADPASRATWSGRGLTPGWLRDLRAAGHSIEEFRVGVAVVSVAPTGVAEAAADGPDAAPPAAKAAKASTWKTGFIPSLTPAVFADPVTGATWSGRGPKPKWLKDLCATGRSLEDFRIGATAIAIVVVAETLEVASEAEALADVHDTAAAVPEVAAPAAAAIADFSFDAGPLEVADNSITGAADIAFDASPIGFPVQAPIGATDFDPEINGAAAHHGNSGSDDIGLEEDDGYGAMMDDFASHVPAAFVSGRLAVVGERFGASA